MFSFESLILLLALFVAVGDGETSTCLTVYEEGGAPAVFQSPKCPRWKLSSYASTPPMTERCQLAMHRGRRYHQEDRTLCILDLRIPFPGKEGIKEVVVGVVAVFDGHNGAEASDMASKLLLEYFVLHTYFLLDSTYSAVFKKSIERLSSRRYDDGVSQLIDWDQVLGHYNLDHERHSVLENFANSSHLEILKEALLRAIHDIDATFTKEASRKKLVSGSTATIILLADGQILVANIGDSKAILCSEQVQSPAQAKATYLRLYRKERSNGAISRVRNDGKSKSRLISSSSLVHLFVQELTRDHHPNRDDERLRVESAGGYVLEWGGVPRVNGQLAVSRAIGDVAFKSYGVISAPELTDWRTVTVNDSYLVAASDGVFEKLSSQDVCDLIWEVDQGHDPAGFRCTYSMADCIVNAAVEKGSTDNVATVVVPLASTDFSFTKEIINTADKGLPQLESKKPLNDVSVKEIGSDVVQVRRAHPVMTKFERLMVEGKQTYVGCFYLSENLDEHTYYGSLVERVDQEDLLMQMQKVGHEGYHLPKALPGALDHYFSGTINLYHDNNLCFHLGMDDDGNKNQCPNGEGFASFVGFLESIPFQDGSLKNGSFENEISNSSYVLNKRFGRGSYGEVWLAFHWHCDQGSNSSGWSEKDNNMSSNTIPFNSQIGNMGSSSDNNHSSPRDSNIFILKRIMVEKGATVYLSGLREKYFGEVFLNASKCLRGYPSAPQTLSSNQIGPRLGIHARIETERRHDTGNSWSFENLIRKKFRLPGGFYEEGLNHIARFVESFESRVNDIWLVFQFEGISLSKLIYTLEVADQDANEQGTEDKKHAQMLHPSKWWHWLKTTEAGKEELRSITWQLLLALKSCHDRNITHRDIKPENMVICFTDPSSGRCLNKIPDGDSNFKAKMRIIDFGSAMDEFTVKHLYGTAGPSRAEQTSHYSPPEALLNSSWHHGATSKTLKYDMWSVGVVILELILGSPNVFQISSYTRALLDQRLEGWNEDLKELAYKLRSFMELCILLTGGFSKHQRATGQVGASPASWKCSEEFFSNQIKSRDPLKLGFTDVWLLRLVRDLLQWEPEERLSVDEALKHPYFKSRPKS